MIEHLEIKEEQIDLIFLVAKLNTMIDKINDLEQIVYDFTGHIKH